MKQLNRKLCSWTVSINTIQRLKQILNICTNCTLLNLVWKPETFAHKTAKNILFAPYVGFDYLLIWKYDLQIFKITWVFAKSCANVPFLLDNGGSELLSRVCPVNCFLQRQIFNHYGPYGKCGNLFFLLSTGLLFQFVIRFYRICKQFYPIVKNLIRFFRFASIQ